MRKISYTIFAAAIMWTAGAGSVGAQSGATGRGGAQLPAQQPAAPACDTETDRFCDTRLLADQFRGSYEKLEADTMKEIDTIMKSKRCQDKRVSGLLDRLVDALDQWNKQEINYWTLWGDAEAVRVEGQQKSLAGMEADQQRAEDLVTSIGQDREKLLRDKADLEKYGERSAPVIKQIDALVEDIKDSESRLADAQKNYDDVSAKVRNMQASINARLVEIRQNKARVEAYGLEMKAFYQKTREAEQEVCNMPQPRTPTSLPPARGGQ